LTPSSPQEQAGLGVAFIAEVERCTLVELAIECRDYGFGPSPPLLSISDGLLFTVTQSEIRILAVMNLKRRPGYWVGRS